MPKVSILIPVYNTDEFVGQAIESVLGQTFYDLELVIVDDASTDDTYSVCENYASTDTRVKLYRNPVNLGMMKNWNRGLSLCTGEYWGKLDADDWWDERMVERCVVVLDTDKEIGLVTTRYLNVAENGDAITSQGYRFPSFAVEEKIDLLPLVKEGPHLMYRYGIAQQGIGLIRRYIFDQLGPFTLLDAGDTEMWFRIGGHFRIFCVNKVLHFHRIWAMNFTRRNVIELNRYDKNLFDATVEIFEHYRMTGLISKNEYLISLRKAKSIYYRRLAIAYLKEVKVVKSFKCILYNLYHFPRESCSFFWQRLSEKMHL